MKHRKYLLRFAMSLSILFYSSTVLGQYENFHIVRATVDFSDILRIWDGFGVNYVQTAHTRDYSDFPQEYESPYFIVRVKDRTNLQGRKVEIDLKGSGYQRFTMVRSIDDRETDQYLGIVETENGKLTCEVPPSSVTTFTGIK
jgi:hypothetical protein